LKSSEIKSVSIGDYLPIAGTKRDGNGFYKEGKTKEDIAVSSQKWQVDYDYLKTMGIKLSKGRNFSRDFGADSSSSSVILNETAAKMLGYNDPIGKKLYRVTGQAGEQVIGLNIIGVVHNFHFESLRQDIGPLCLGLGRSTWLAEFKINTANIRALLKQIESKWKVMASGMPFSYRFLDEGFDNMYRAERRTGKIALIFSILTILVACLGLFGLATFMAEQRTKEISIRKVLGLSIGGIVQLLSKDFLKLVLIAFVIAIPVASYFMNKWLMDFAYRINISWWVFATAGITALFIALLTVSFQAIKAAVANPVKSLRTE
jgi:putative ABC transport system permease protein